MHSRRYRNLERIAAKTGGRCHLCHEPVDLELYGPTGFHGDDTATVDHVEPQAYGGDDDEENLLIAHGTCNSYRGTRDVEDVRLELAGTTAAPMSSGARVGLTLLASVAAGHVFAKPGADGRARFSGTAALVTGAIAIALLSAA